MSKIVKKILLLIITLIFTTITLTGVTFAWLSINSDAWVEGMQIQATAGKGFLISVDGKRYKSNLDDKDLMKAAILKYRKAYSLNEDGDLLDEGYNIIKPSDYHSIFKKIKFNPCTSYSMDGLDLSNLNGTIIDPSKGEFIEFDIYFQSTGELNSDMNIYLNGNTKVVTQDGTNIEVNPSKIDSSLDEIELLGKLITFDKTTNEKIEKNYNDKLLVKSSNAIRIGIMEEEQNPIIVELTDEYDLGSYATNISDYTDEDNPLYDENIVYNMNYDSNYNAMFTYTADTAEILEPIDYKKMPLTIKSLHNGQDMTVRVANLYDQKNVKKVTFRIWLEGWDADCINGITKTVNVQLSFVQQ